MSEGALSLADDLRTLQENAQHVRRPDEFKVESIMRTLDGETHGLLLELLIDERISARDITVALNRAGYSVGASSVKRYRRKLREDV